MRYWRSSSTTWKHIENFILTNMLHEIENTNPSTSESSLVIPRPRHSSWSSLEQQPTVLRFPISLSSFHQPIDLSTDSRTISSNQAASNLMRYRTPWSLCSIYGTRQAQNTFMAFWRWCKLEVHVCLCSWDYRLRNGRVRAAKQRVEDWWWDLNEWGEGKLFLVWNAAEITQRSRERMRAPIHEHEGCVTCERRMRPSS